MEKEFVPYELAVKLKELGFDENCLSYWEGESFSHHLATMTSGDDYIIPAPLYQQVFRFFRDKYNILATIYSNASGYLYEWHDAVGGTHRGWSEYEGPNDGGVWDTYEEAELACLKKLIEIVEQQKQK